MSQVTKNIKVNSQNKTNNLSAKIIFFSVILFIFSFPLFGYNNFDDCMSNKMLEQKGKNYLSTKNECERLIGSSVKKSDNEVWKVGGEVDPASGKNIARTAWTKSSDEKCKLAVENRIDGTELIALYCPNIP
jgi:hypothetical protein